MAVNEINISPEQMLAAIHANLSGQFFEANKTTAKQTYTQLVNGGSLPLLEISSPEHGEVIGHLALDFSEFIGKLNYSTFRDALASHLNRIAEKLKNKDKLNIFTNAETGAMLFNIPGLVQTGEQVNVLVTGVEQSRPGEIVIKMMFLDPANFIKS